MTYSLFTVLPALVILFWLILFFLDENKDKAKRFLIFFLTVALVNYMTHWYYFNHNYDAYYLLESIWVFTSLSVYPLYYYYIRLLTSDVKINYRWIWILFPALILSLFSAFIYIMMSPQEIDIFNNEILYHNRSKSENYSSLIKLQMIRMEAFKVLFALGVILTVFYGLRLLKKFNEQVYAFYSDVQHRELSTIKTTFLFLVFTAIVSIISSVLGKDFFVEKHFLLALPSITHSIALFGISYAGYRQSFSIADLTKDQFQPVIKNLQVEDEVNIVLDSRYDELFERMENLLNQKEIFKDPDLRLNDLAFMLGTNRTYVSQLINNKTNSNFCEYINVHRIAYAKNILSSTKESLLTIDEIALQSGFSTQSSFYRVFMKMEGISPARYRKKVAGKMNQ